jgi:gluconokinase
MGVTGAGKTTVGRALAAALGWAFFDADDFHPPANVDRMRRGVPLTDEDRAPWLAALRALLARRLAEGAPMVLACSALKQRYREALVPPDAPAGAVRFVHLDAARTLVARRLEQRRDHFMPATLVDSQLAALEEPEEGEALRLDAAQPVEASVERVLAWLKR